MKLAAWVVIWALLTCFWYFVWAPLGKAIAVLGIIAGCFLLVSWLDMRAMDRQTVNDRIFKQSKRVSNIERYKARVAGRMK